MTDTPNPHPAIAELVLALEEPMLKFGSSETSFTFTLTNGDTLFVQLTKAKFKLGKTEEYEFEDEDSE